MPRSASTARAGPEVQWFLAAVGQDWEKCAWSQPAGPGFARIRPKGAQNALDFAGPASLAAGVDDVIPDQIRMAFADLTGLVEDAASLAAEW